ncbi:polyisoprenoid-binding protein YceI [Filimonas zeae]|uniref:Polyisoprenoid-binding protein n=1 Tax=Filimonas zeae TaxID=1737353 RepID=A0A917MU74_9BACT|nr:YceI family protein [Filimonas zeae]MDR6339245.1 polyisoprenoid-binding protein YceI [Filimonas zeae]GGH64446.1 polyisoprenoid-binding protein [Filimonas zeae]
MQTNTWTIDPTHSEIQFKVKHLVITTITGAFTQFTGNVTAGDDFHAGEVSFDAHVNSISTNNAQRDEHLKSADFFEADKYPMISFKSTSFKRIGGEDFELTGDLTIKDVTKPVVLDVTYGGAMKDPWGNEKAGFELKGVLNRTDFNLTWNAVTEAGGLLVGEDIRLLANIQLTRG